MRADRLDPLLYFAYAQKLHKGGEKFIATRFAANAPSNLRFPAHSHLPAQNKHTDHCSFRFCTLSDIIYTSEARLAASPVNTVLRYQENSNVDSGSNTWKSHGFHRIPNRKEGTSQPTNPFFIFPSTSYAVRSFRFFLQQHRWLLLPKPLRDSPFPPR